MKAVNFYCEMFHFAIRLKEKAPLLSPTSHADDRKQSKSKVNHMKAVNFYCEMFHFAIRLKEKAPLLSPTSHAAYR